jgi:hypothetical protein
MKPRDIINIRHAHMSMQINKVLVVLRLINPLIHHIKLDKKKAEAFLELLEVLKYHTQSTEIMI